MVKICPNCKSQQIGFFIGFETGNYKCVDCNYVGPIILEEISKKKK